MRKRVEVLNSAWGRFFGTIAAFFLIQCGLWSLRNADGKTLTQPGGGMSDVIILSILGGALLLLAAIIMAACFCGLVMETSRKPDRPDRHAIPKDAPIDMRPALRRFSGQLDADLRKQRPTVPPRRKLTPEDKLRAKEYENRTQSSLDNRWASK